MASLITSDGKAFRIGFTRLTGRNSMRLAGILSWAAVIFFLGAFAHSQTGGGVETTTLTTSQVVEGMQRHDQLQTQMLRHYEGLRHYSVVYRGFLRTITASMDVEMNYEPSSGKTFRIISQKGSGMLCEKVLKRALDSEREASLNKSSTALNPANYKFELAGTDRVGDRPSFVLNVEPISPSKFLYKGQIWVDAADFAVTKMEVQPAVNPSFWISRTLIHHTNEIENGFWLPEQNRSETKVRVGGTATMTIDYSAYRINTQNDLPTTTSQAGGR